MCVEKTKERVIKAFIEMLNETSIESIRVKDIIEKTNISKSTFYRLFRDKYDVMNWVYFEPIDTVVNTLDDLNNWNKTWAYASFNCILKHKVFFRNIISYSGQNSFQEFMFHYYAHNMTNQICFKTGNNNLSEEIKFAIEAFSLICTYAKTKYIKNNFKPSPKKVLDQVKACLPACIKEYFE